MGVKLRPSGLGEQLGRRQAPLQQLTQLQKLTIYKATDKDFYFGRAAASRHAVTQLLNADVGKVHILGRVLADQPHLQDIQLKQMHVGFSRILASQLIASCSQALLQVEPHWSPHCGPCCCLSMIEGLQ